MNNKFIDFNAAIISCCSVGNVHLGDNISIYLDEILLRHHLDVTEYFIPDDEKRIAYTLDDTITIATLPDGLIFSIGCNQNYKGRYNHTLYTGQSIGEIFQLTKKQSISNGSLIVNKDFGLSFILPPPYDEIADRIEDIPSDLIINEIYVADFLSWRYGG